MQVGRAPGVRKWMMRKRHFEAFGYQVSLSFSEACGHLSFGLLAVSYAFSDMMALRVFAIGSVGSMMIFNYWHPVGFPLWLPFRWNALFLAINVLWIGSMLKQNRMNWIDSRVDLDEVRTHVFPSLQKVDFARLMKTAEYHEYPATYPLMQEGANSEYVYLVVKGTARVSKGGDRLYDISTCQFVGTLGVHTSLYIEKAMTSAKVTSRVLRCLRWKKEDLANEVSSNPRLLAAVDAALSIDELRKTFSAARPQIGDQSKVHESVKMYELLVQSVMGEEDQVSDQTKNALKRFRVLYGVPYEKHLKALQKSGWTKQQYSDGDKSPDKHHNDEAVHPNHPNSVVGELH